MAEDEAPVQRSLRDELETYKHRTVPALGIDAYAERIYRATREVTDAQHAFDSDPELRDLLARAAAAPTVRRARTRRP